MSGAWQRLSPVIKVWARGVSQGFVFVKGIADGEGGAEGEDLATPMRRDEMRDGPPFYGGDGGREGAPFTGVKVKRSSHSKTACERSGVVVKDPYFPCCASRSLARLLES